MNFYKASRAVRISGEVALSEAQAKRRAGRIRPVQGKKGVYQLDELQDFKAGEIIGLETVPKALYRYFVGGENGEHPTPVDPNNGNPIMKKETAKPEAEKPANQRSAASEPASNAAK